ncbi:MAG: acetyltransferase [Chromatiales bacterium]|jgi:UDP-perosamine 4-acetyltransferase
MNPPIIMLGNGGHAAVLQEILLAQSQPFAGFTAPDKQQRFSRTLNYLGEDSVVEDYAADEVRLVNGIGSVGSTSTKARLFEEFSQKNYQFADVIHPTAIVSDSATLGKGVQLLAGSVVNTGAVISDNVLLNSRAVVEHHCRIGKHCHIASSATVCGDCVVGDNVHIGAGAIVLQGVTIGAGAVIAAGSVVIKDVESLTLVAGVPASFRKQVGS